MSLIFRICEYLTGPILLFFYWVVPLIAVDIRKGRQVETATLPMITPVAGFEHWVSPNGIAHLVPVVRDGLLPETRPCVTCGRKHDVGHFRTFRKYVGTYRPELRRQCVTEVIDWPYPCDAQRLYPQHMVYKCTLHGVWWHE